MIKELSELGAKQCKTKYKEWDNVALKEEPVSIELVIDENGNFYQFNPFEKNTIAEALTSKKGKARLLLDKAEEVLSYGTKAEKKHEWFINKLKKYSDLPELKPVIAFYEANKENGIEKAKQEFEKQIPNEKQRKGNIAFRIQGKNNRIHEESNVCTRIIQKYEEEHKIQGTCSICGKADYPVEDIPHGMIKRVPEGQTSGCALVSYNEDAFESYGLKGNENSAICSNCARTYVEGLNWLITNGYEITDTETKKKNKKKFRYTNRKNFGSDTAMVYWTRENSTIPEVDYLEEPKASDITQLIESVTSGKETNSRYIEQDRFYSFTLSGVAARIAVRDWIETSLSELKQSIAQWFKDIAIDEYDKDLKQMQTRYFPLYILAKSCQNPSDKNDKSLSRTAVYLWNAALKNSSLPIWILARVLQRARLGGVTAERAALIKLILNRNNKGGSYLNAEGQKPVAYICGQIFAEMENIQYYALGNRNAGIRERYFTYAMTAPLAAFGRLFNLNSKHYTKLKNDKPGLAITLDKELQVLCKDIDINKLSTTFSLEEQGQFAIGYYKQRQLQFNKSKLKENKNNKEEN
jgi:CRISPR-associated protein Csd1